MKNTKNILLKKLEEIEEICSNKLDEVRKLINSSKNIKEDIDLFTITTYSQVCKELDEEEETCPYKQIKQIEKLFNKDWIKDWDNNQQKWFPYFNLRPSDGLVGFYYSGYYFSSSYGQVAFYKDKQTSDHIGKNFWSIYKQII